MNLRFEIYDLSFEKFARHVEIINQKSQIVIRQ